MYVRTMVDEQYTRYQSGDITVQEKIVHRFIDLTHEYTKFLSRDDNEIIVGMVYRASTLIGEKAHDIYKANAVITASICEIMFILRDIMYPDLFKDVPFDIITAPNTTEMYVMICSCLNVLVSGGVISFEKGIDVLNEIGE